jgi:hypothetical protein
LSNNDNNSNNLKLEAAIAIGNASSHADAIAQAIAEA